MIKNNNRKVCNGTDMKAIESEKNIVLKFIAGEVLSCAHHVLQRSCTFSNAVVVLVTVRACVARAPDVSQFREFAQNCENKSFVDSGLRRAGGSGLIVVLLLYCLCLCSTGSWYGSQWARDQSLASTGLLKRDSNSLLVGLKLI